LAIKIRISQASFERLSISSNNGNIYFRLLSPRLKGMQVTLIHNPDAGDDTQPSGGDLVRLIRDKGHAVAYQSSRAENWYTALEVPVDIVAVAGGDGMVGEVAKHLIDKHVPIAVLPMGTANNIAKTLGLKDRSLEQLVAGWSAAPRVSFDVGVASGPWDSKYFIEGLGMGLSLRPCIGSMPQTTPTLPIWRTLEKRSNPFCKY
jgi:Diacylglycerol kinase catalytic domain